MTTSATESVSPPLLNPEPRTLNPRWQPDGDAHLIYRWVKFEGKSQSWVASAFRVSQSTISRIIQRYKRWQAHAKERENGRLDRAERLRAQRWLTFERNELILASCLRIAGDLEGSLDTSKSTITRHASEPSRELEVRTHHACVDRTGMVSRFLRLAHRINMEQLKLAELAEPPAAEALSPEELAAEEAQAAADAAELAAARHRGADIPVCQESADGGQETETCPQTERQSDGETEGDAASSDTLSPSLPPSVPPSSNLNPEPRTLNPSVHNVHTENSPEIATTTSQPCTCTLEIRIQKNSPGACITDGYSQPSSDENGIPANEISEPAPTAV
jgi:transposase